MPKLPETIVLNALHTNGGGGLTYLKGIMPELARDGRFQWVLLAPEAALEGGWVPANVTVKVAPKLGFVLGHLWEQLVLPGLALRWGAKTILCNANYAPLLAWRSVPIVHTTPRAAGYALSGGMRVYWWVLKLLTRVSLWNAPVAFSVAHHVIADYVGPRSARKVRVAPPAIATVEPKDEAGARDGNLVVAIGDLYAQKDYPLLVRAFGKLLEQRPTTRLMLVGRPVDGRVRDEVLGLIRDLKLSQAVTLTGGMPHAQLMGVLQRAAVFVNTSKAECFNIPVLEAMAQGVPCVLPDADFQVEVADSAAVYVPVDKGGDVAAAFAVALYGVLENPLVARGLRAKGLARAKMFTWQATAQVLADGLAKKG